MQWLSGRNLVSRCAVSRNLLVVRFYPTKPELRTRAIVCLALPINPRFCSKVLNIFLPHSCRPLAQIRVWLSARGMTAITRPSRRATSADVNRKRLGESKKDRVGGCDYTTYSRHSLTPEYAMSSQTAKNSRVCVISSRPTGLTLTDNRTYQIRTE